MDFANRGNRPTQAPQQSTGFQNEQTNAPSFKPGDSNKKKMSNIDMSKATSSFLFVGLVVLIVALIIGLVFGGDGGNRESSQIKEDQYQAVFLDSPDGQVYFGKLGILNRDLYVLTDIYYVRVEQPIQPEGVNQPAQPNISLAKLGQELHGPEDVMFIRRDKVLYWENLKDDGQVVTAIREFKENGDDGGDAGAQQQQQNGGGAAGIQPEGTGNQNPTTPTPTAPPTPPAPNEDEDLEAPTQNPLP